MSFLDALPPVVLGVGIFLLRIVDVSIGTVRTISVIQGHARVAVALGFVEVMIWIMAVAQVVTRLNTHPWLAPFYAGGYATGVGVGMLIERRLSAGRYLIRIISHTKAAEVAAAVEPLGRVLGTFPGATQAGPASLVFISAIGRRVPEIVTAVRAVDPELVYTVEMALSWSENIHPATGGWDWRSRVTRK
ncbi:MAG TPA: DUF5698 domain-containing protein [Gemmatimonadales bacterium]|nr:DUF5698 domain-containing protein [Gemmatimonadales bacterium]